MLSTGLDREPTLFDSLSPGLSQLAPSRTWLDTRSWVDLQPTWMAGADSLFEPLVAGLPWKSDRRVMYERMVDVPRLTAFLGVHEAPIPPLVTAMAVSLSSHYRENFDWLGVNLYRGGSDSVAWHADRVGRVETDPLVAVVSIGGPRRLALRPKGGGKSIGFDMWSGDLLVMGGACQHRWEHRVPKVAAAPPRISLTFRHGVGRPT